MGRAGADSKLLELTPVTKRSAVGVPFNRQEWFYGTDLVRQGSSCPTDKLRGLMQRILCSFSRITRMWFEVTARRSGRNCVTLIASIVALHAFPWRLEADVSLLKG